MEFVNFTVSQLVCYMDFLLLDGGRINARHAYFFVTLCAGG